MSAALARYGCAVIPELQPGEAVAVDWTESDYFGDTSALTRSSLLLADKNPRAFCQRWILGQRIDVDEPSEAKSLGTWTHLALLEPPELLRRFGVPIIPRPKGAKKSAAKGSYERKLYDEWVRAVEQREAFMRQIPGRIDLGLDDIARVTAISQCVWTHPEAAALLRAPGKSEQTVLWREPTTGLLMKVRLDRLVELDAGDIYGTKLEEGPAVVDVKTTRDHTERAFARSILNYGYLDQAAIYTDAAEALLGARPQFHFLAIRSESNYGVADYRLNERQLARGRTSYLAKLRDLKKRMETNDWLAECERGVRSIYLPGDE